MIFGSQFGRTRSVLVSACVLFALTLPSLAAAQNAKPDDPSKWGVQVSFSKDWKIATWVQDFLSDDDEKLNFEGSEFEIGFVRGSKLGGDWGVSFVKKPFKDGVITSSIDTDCFNQAQTACKPRTETNVGKDVLLTGVEFHWFIRIVNIKDRVQAGVNVGGGIGSFSGQIVKTTDRSEPTGYNNQGNPTGYRDIHEVETNEAKDELLKYFPMGKIEAVGSVILSSHAKVQVAYGLNFPGNGARVMGVYLF